MLGHQAMGRLDLRECFSLENSGCGLSQITTRLTSFQEYLDSIKNLITYHDKFVKIGGIQGEQSFAGLENTVNAKTGFKGTLDVDKHVERFAGNVTPYQNSNLNFTDKTKNSAQFF